jgi:hypothetical protein
MAAKKSAGGSFETAEDIEGLGVFARSQGHHEDEGEQTHGVLQRFSEIAAPQ